MYEDKLCNELRKEEFKSLLMANVGYTTGKKNCTIIPFGEAIKLLNEKVKDNLIKMKGWKHSKDIYTSQSGVSKTKEEWFKDVKRDKVPAFTLTSYANNIASAQEILNPYIIVDIDGIEVTDKIFDILNSRPFVLGSAISTSGEGVWSVIKFDINAVTNGEDLKELVQALYEKYDCDYGIKIDRSCSNPNRLRFVSPYEFELNDYYEGPFTFHKSPNKQVKLKDEIQMDYFNTGSTNVPPRFQFLGEQGEDYYREAKMPYIKYGEEGKNYELLWSYSNAIYKICGDEGFKVFCNYFPTTSEGELKKYWGTSKNSRKDIRNFIQRELVGIGVIDRESSVDKSDLEW